MTYRFFKLNAGGVVDSAETARFASDDAAVAHARGFAIAGAVEVWDGTRKVTTIPPPSRR